MEKIGQLTVEQFEVLKNTRSEAKVLKHLWKMINLPAIPKYKLGDTMVTIDNSELYGVYKETHANRDHYYLVVSVIDERMAFSWTFYKGL